MSYNLPTSPDILDQVLTLGPQQREFFEERAGVIEFDGGLTRAEAEEEALKQTKYYFNGNLF